MKIPTHLTKKPFTKVLPKGNINNVTSSPLQPIAVEEDNNLYEIIPQSQFLRELDPNGHKIMSVDYYPDKITYDDSDRIKSINNGKGMWIRTPVFRYSVPLQQIILIKHLASLCGNKIKIKNTAPDKKSSQQRELLSVWKQKWEDKNMDESFYQCVKSEKSTGDCAIVFFFDAKGRICHKTLSFRDGDILYNFIDDKTGETTSFARRYNITLEDGAVIQSCIEYWDNRKFYRFVSSDESKEQQAGAASLGFEGYACQEEEYHNFPCCPVVYKRNEFGACWTPVQHSIDQFEMEMSLLGENSKIYAFPIMFLLGDDADIKGGLDGRPYAITSSNSDTKVGLMSQPNESGNFKLLLETSLSHILMGSFTVIPPEVRSGDLSGSAIKLIYSPALEKGLADAKEWNPFIDRMVELFNYGLGIELKRPSDFNSLSVHGTIVPYIHQNTSEIVNNLCQSVASGILSVETALEENPFSAPDEKGRVNSEDITTNMQDFISENGLTENNIEQKTNSNTDGKN